MTDDPDDWLAGFKGLAKELFTMVKRTEPFRPFRLHLKDGRTVDVLYPQHTLVDHYHLVVDHPDAEMPEIGSGDYVRVWMRDIDRVEPLPAEAKAI